MSTLFEVVKQYRSVYIMTHRSPDADAIASAFGLYTLLLNLGVNPTIIISDENESFKVNVQKLIERYDIPIIFRPLKSHIQDEECFYLLTANMMQQILLEYLPGISVLSTIILNLIPEIIFSRMFNQKLAPAARLYFSTYTTLKSRSTRILPQFCSLESTWTQADLLDG